MGSCLFCLFLFPQFMFICILFTSLSIQAKSMSESTPMLHLFIAHATMMAEKKENSDPILKGTYLETEIGESYAYKQVLGKELVLEVVEV